MSLYSFKLSLSTRSYLPPQPSTRMSSSYIYASLSLIALCSLAGAGVGVGSGVAMMYSAMAEEESKKVGAPAVAHSVVEKKAPVSRGFAASGASSQ
ncbi:hypothetical protein WJX72_006833 [[Myrmecia] bisecta]|uniref:Uncharacterized protein n=1 Tax=[Myrmecia] bisecta TaxID=41462 RepID=A0AAW1PWI0_9CHLO